MVKLGFTAINWYVLDFTGFLLGFILDLSALYWVLLGYSWLNRFVLGLTG